METTIQGTAPKKKKIPRELDIWADNTKAGWVFLGCRVPTNDEPAWSIRVKIADLKAAVANL